MQQILDKLQTKSNRETTVEQYMNTWRLFNSFLIRLDKMPPTWEERLFLYVGYCIDRGLQSATVKSYISGIKFMAELIDHEWNIKRAKLLTLTRACKLENDRVRTRLPIQKSLLETTLFELERTYEMQPFLELLYKTVLLLGYYGMLRIGELTTGKHPILARDIHVADNKNKILLVLHSSKTHGKESRPQHVKIESLDRDIGWKPANTYYCPFETTRLYMKARGPYWYPDEPLFIFSDHTPVRPSHVRKILKQQLTKISLNHHLYNTHSLHIGRATDLSKRGIQFEKIKQLGRWRSNAIYNYLKEF